MTHFIPHQGKRERQDLGESAELANASATADFLISKHYNRISLSPLRTMPFSSNATGQVSTAKALRLPEELTNANRRSEPA
jgi:hypothetical protein